MCVPVCPCHLLAQWSSLNRCACMRNCLHGVEATETAEFNGCTEFCLVRLNAVTIWQQFARRFGATFSPFYGSPVSVQWRYCLPPYSIAPTFFPRLNVNSHQNSRRYVPEDRIFNIFDAHVTDYFARKPVICEICLTPPVTWHNTTSFLLTSMEILFVFYL